MAVEPGTSISAAKKRARTRTTTAEPPTSSSPTPPALTGHAPTASAGEKRMCRVCGIHEAPKGGQGGLSCPQCYRAQRTAGSKICKTCDNVVRNKKVAYCSVPCYIADVGVDNAKECSDDGCSKIIMPGLGAKCESHVRRKKKAKEV
ncbi:hypothetical protein HDV05_006876 [Chytridiales sp. JEL 0842]|nr:hypothetical protein HDV05_006876 [Chytridiales sp. JEL 0842]